MLTHAVIARKATDGGPERKARAGNALARLPVTPQARASIRNILRGPAIQPKLQIGTVGAPAEREADAVADKVMRMPVPSTERGAAMPSPSLDPGPNPVRRMCAECRDELKRQPSEDEDDKVVQRMTGSEGGEVEEETLVQPKETPGAGSALSPSSESAIRGLGSGAPLARSERAFFEPRFGRDFSDVRIHNDATADVSAKSINARAFTLGTNIAFANGEYAPGSPSGRRLLAHELTHTVQQQENGERSRLQRDFALEPPRPEAVGRDLSEAQMQAAIAFNERFLDTIPNSAAVIRMIRNVLGTSPDPADIDEDFVNVVVKWQAVQRLTQDGMLGPRSAQRLFLELAAEGGAEGRVLTGPTYSPNGTIAPRPIAGGEDVSFDLDAEFESDPARGIYPSCCEVRQALRWDADRAAGYLAALGRSVPHAGFPPAHPADQWIEDTNGAGDFHYGHRTGLATGTNQYLDSSGHRNQAYGHIYSGSDRPQTGVLAGQFQFRMTVHDVCNGDARLGEDFIRINW